jgi:hypothetical protein
MKSFRWFFIAAQLSTFSTESAHSGLNVRTLGMSALWQDADQEFPFDRIHANRDPVAYRQVMRPGIRHLGYVPMTLGNMRANGARVGRALRGVPEGRGIVRQRLQRRRAGAGVRPTDDLHPLRRDRGRCEAELGRASRRVHTRRTPIWERADPRLWHSRVIHMPLPMGT